MSVEEELQRSQAALATALKERDEARQAYTTYFSWDPILKARADAAEALASLCRMECHRERIELGSAHNERLVKELNAAEARERVLRITKDAAYHERNQCVALIMRMALALGWRAGVGVHKDTPDVKWEEDWRTLVSVDLPSGQASWHFHDSERHLLEGLPEYAGEWDGHDTPEKYHRVNAALAQPTAPQGLKHAEGCF